MSIVPIKGNLNATKTFVNRKLLQKTTNLKSLNGPYEVKEAKKIVAFYTAENAATGAFSAQMPGLDEVLLTGNEIAMATVIINGIYDFKLKDSLLKNILTGFVGNRVGSWAAKSLSKAVTWIPGIGNGINATVAGSTTAALGMEIINWCEKIDKEKKRGKKIDEILGL